MRRLLALAAALAIAYGAWQDWRLRELERAPGVLAPGDPRQEPLEPTSPIRLGEYTLEPQARYALTARILSREPYRFHREAELSPLDFALGWGPMSDSAVLEQIEIEQSSRYYTLHWRSPPLPPETMLSHSANTHLIPADPALARRLAAMRPGQVVELSGYLVNARAVDGWHWNSSLSRTDTGRGACELFYVEQAHLVGY